MTFSFTWGRDLEDLGHVQVFRFMLRTYSELGLSRAEMLVLIHAASYHYNSPTGQSRPSVATIADEMGYQDRAPVSRLLNSLEQKGMLVIHRKPGQPNIYDASPFAAKAYALWQRGYVEKSIGGYVEKDIGGMSKPTYKEEEEEEESKKTNLPPKAGSTEPIELDLDEIFWELEDTGQRKESMTAQCPYCQGTLTQQDDACPGCKTPVIWEHSPLWKSLYGKPTAYRQRLRGVDLVPQTPLQIKAAFRFNGRKMFANKTQRKRFLTLEGKYPSEFLETLITWATKPDAFKGFDAFEAAATNPNNLKEWEARQREDDTPDSQPDDAQSVLDDWAKWLAGRQEVEVTA